MGFANGVQGTADEEVYMNGTCSGLTYRSKQLSHDVPFDNLTEDGTVFSRPLKRSRDVFEYEAGDDRYNRSRSPPSGSRRARARLDHYSPRKSRRPVSPSNTRHAFIPDHEEYWSPKYRPRKLSVGSAESKHHSRQGDFWVPPDRWPSIGRDASGSSNRPQSKTSPPASSHQNGNSVIGQQYRNLTWKAPGVHKHGVDDVTPNTMAPVSNPVSTSGSFEPNGVSAATKVSYNGLEGVPIGPKHGPSLPNVNKTDKAPLPEVSPEIRRRPHIFISSRWLPARRATVKHLYGCLSKHVLREADIAIDQSGYYIMFEDDDLERLDQCYAARSGEQLFNMYCLNMECFRSGLEHSLSSNKDEVSKLNLDLPKAGACDERPASAQASSPDISAPPPRYSSPLRASIRQEKDDSASSISGLTSSDLSASKPPKCHICKVASLADTDVLIHCSSCPRRYHTWCHVRPLIPSEARTKLSHLWQCRRCVKKQVQPRSRLSNTSLATSGSPAPSVGQPEHPRTKELPLEDLETLAVVESPGSVVVRAETDVLDAPGNAKEENVVRAETDQNTLNASTHNNTIAESLSIHAEDDPLREANDLVEKSFALSGNAGDEAVKPAKSRKLNFNRKKLSGARSNGISSVVDSVKLGHFLNESSTNENTQTTLQVEEPTVSKRKSHKWEGGGADKAIIREGMKSLLKIEPSPISEHVTASEVRSPNVSAALEHEVLESPEESRGPNGLNNTLNGYNSTGATSSNPRSTTKLKMSSKDDTKRSIEGDQQTAVAQRMKPSNLAIDKCSKCQKPIAFNPSGTNKLCSRCKKKSTNDPSVNDTKSFANASGPEEPLSGATSEPISSTTVGREVNSTASIALLETTSTLPDGIKNLASVSEPHPHQTMPDALCPTCNNRRKRCKHGFLDSRKTAPADEQSKSSAVAQTGPGADDDRAEDDLDFWNTQATSQVVSKAIGDGIVGSSRKEDLDVQSHLKPHTQRSSPLSPPPAEDTPGTPNKTSLGNKKRKSNTVVATSEHDLGNGYRRPKNTYEKLIGMALCAAPRQSLKTKEILYWIDENIPGYTIGEGTKWEVGISATLSMRQEKENGKQGLWKKIESDSAKKNSACRYELLPGMAQTMLHWDPVLVQPVSPAKIRQSNPSNDENDNRSFETIEDGDFHDAQRRSEANEAPKIDPADCPLSPSKMDVQGRAGHRSSIRNDVYESDTSDAMEIDSSDEHDQAETDQQMMNDTILNEMNDESFDDEPLFKARYKAFNAKAATFQRPASQTAGSDVSRDNTAQMMELDDVNGVSDSTEVTSSDPPFRTPFIRQEQLHVTATEEQNLAQVIRKDAENFDYSGNSLFSEWPEYDPDNHFDKYAKTAEIKRRPTRKQRFGKTSRDPWLDWHPPRLAKSDFSRGSSMSIDRPSRTTRNSLPDAYPWENGEGHIQQCGTLEELFGIPNNPIAIIHDGQLAYRDGTRNEDGSLPRAKHIYKTGYA